MIFIGTKHVNTMDGTQPANLEVALKYTFIITKSMLIEPEVSTPVLIGLKTHPNPPSILTSQYLTKLQL